MENSNKTHQSTYQYKKPFRFMGAEYTDSGSLADAFIDNWDIAVSVFRRGSMEGFWEEYVQDADKLFIDLSATDAFFHEAYEQMWDVKKNEKLGLSEADVIFQVILHYIEPALNGIPFIRAEDNDAKLYSFEEFGKWLFSLLSRTDGGEWKGPGEVERRFKADKWNYRIVKNAAEHKVFSTYVPGTKEAEEKFLKADDDQKGRLLGELAIKIQEKEYFWYNNYFYTSMEEFAPVLKEQLEKGEDVQLFRDLFGSDKYSDSFMNWSAKVYGEKHREKLEELGNRWYYFWYCLRKIHHSDLAQVTIVYSTSRSLLNQFPLKNDAIKSFLEEKIAAARAKIAPIKKELEYNQALEEVVIGIVDVGFMQKQDMEQILSLKTIRDKIESLQPYLENEEAYKDGLERVLTCFEGKQLALGWNEVDRDGKTLLLASGWHSLPTVEPNQAEALLEKINESWQADKDASLLVDAREILLSVLKKGLFGGSVEHASKGNTRVKTIIACWDRTSEEGASAYEQCLELIDRVSGLCVGIEDNVELAENRNKICELINAKALEPFEQAFSKFSEKYQKNEDAVINIVKKSGCFGGISYDGEKKVVIKYSEPHDKDKYPVSVIAMIKNECQTASDYLSDYRQQIEKLEQELSAIREAGCHYGKLREDLEKHKRFMAAVKDAEDELRKSFANADPLMEEPKRQMLKIDREREEKEKEQRRKEKEKEEEQKRKEKEKEEEQRRKEKEKEERRHKAGMLKLDIEIFLENHWIPLTGLTVLVVAFVVLFLRYASPTYYGTKFYLGNRINYSEYKIADSVEKIYPETFKGAGKMTHIEIPEGVSEIGDSAFMGCSSLEEINFPSNLEIIGRNAFCNCISLKNIKLNENLKEIGDYAFKNCTRLIEVDMPTEFQYSWNGIFENCCNLDADGIEGLDPSRLYTGVVKGMPLLENETQLKNALYGNSFYIPDVNEYDKFEYGKGTLLNIRIGNEASEDNKRFATFSCDYQVEGVLRYYHLSGKLYSEEGSDNPSLHVDISCTGIDPYTYNQILAQDENGEYPVLKEFLDGYYIDDEKGEHRIPIVADQITDIQAELAPMPQEEGTEEDLEKNDNVIVISAVLNNPMGTVAMHGTISPVVCGYDLQLEVPTADDIEINLMGVYQGSQWTLEIGNKYENYYSVSVTENESSGKWILIEGEDLWGEENTMIYTQPFQYTEDLVEIDWYNAKLTLADRWVFSKTDESIGNPVDMISPVIGYWKGSYSSSSMYTREFEGCIIPYNPVINKDKEVSKLVMIWKFPLHPDDPVYDKDKYNVVLGIVDYNKEDHSIKINPKEWLERKQSGFTMVAYEGFLDESGTVMSGSTSVGGYFQLEKVE